MKKEDVSGIIVYLFMLAIAIVFGLTILTKHSANSGMERGIYFLFLFGAIATGIIVNSLLFEFAHFAGAKAGGYRVISWCVLGFTFLKLDNKLKFRFANFDGLTGETKIVPAQDREKPSNPTPYLWFGTLFYVIEMIAVIVVFILFGNSSDQKLVNVAYFVLVAGSIGLLILIYNIVPLKLDSTTDGYRMKLVSNPKNKEAFNELLRVEYEISNGNTDVEIKTFDTITNFTADLNLNKVYVLLEKENFAEAEPLLQLIVENKANVSNNVYLRARAQMIYIEIMTKDLAEAKEYYDKQVSLDERRQLSNDVSMESIRTYILMAGLFDKSKSECVLALNKVYKAFKHTPKQRQKVEIDLFNKALQKIIDQHKDWEFEDYLLSQK